MKEIDKALQLCEKFKDFVNPYIGSGMLSNSYDDSAILFQSKKCAKVSVNELIDFLKLWKFDNEVILYWENVNKEIDKL